MAIIKLFADDTNFLISGENFDLLRQMVICELQSFQKWIYANILSINYDPQKSSYCIFNPKQKSLPCTYNQDLFVGGHKLCYNEFTKYLGLIIDDQLTWNKHNTEINKTVVKYTGIFSKLRHLLTKECRMTLYNSFVFSRLNYGVEVYANTNMKFLSRLKTSQNKVLRILQFKHRKSAVDDLYVTFEVLKLADMQKDNLLTIMYKFMHTPNEFPAAFKDLFIQNSQIHGYNTRNKYDLHAAHVNTKNYCLAYKQYGFRTGILVQ